jgi:hypothetical protein
MITPTVGSRFRHKWLKDYPTPPDDTGHQLPNVFTVFGISDGSNLNVPEGCIGVTQEDQPSPEPTWWIPMTFSDLFEPLPLVPIHLPPSIL